MVALALRTDRTVIALPAVRDENDFLDAVRGSTALHHPWVSPPTDARTYRAYLERLERDDHYGFLIRRDRDAVLAGVININSVVRGSFQSGYLGYYAFSAAAGTGLMAEALRAVAQHAFGALGLHRLEANIQPGNEPSLRLAQRCGFRREGFSPDYLMVDGAWRDHERWAITAPAS